MSFSLVPRRSYEPEIMDRPDNTYEDLAAAFRDLSRINRRLGGIRTLWRPVRDAALRLGLREFTILDVGMGGGEIPRAVVAMGAAEGLTVRAAGADLDPVTVRYAAEQSRAEARVESHAGGVLGTPMPVLRADAFALPFPDRGFDFVTCSLMFHHFREDDAAKLLAEFARVARRAVVVNDLERHWIAWATISLLSPMAESPMVRHDGPLSVLRAWTPDELLALARGAGLGARARVERLFPYRLVLTVAGDTPA